MRPQEIPATGALIGTPASISARVEPQTEPCEVEPLDEMTSDTKRSAYGNSLHGRNDRQQRTLRERAVADLAAARAAGRAGFRRPSRTGNCSGGYSAFQSLHRCVSSILRVAQRTQRATRQHLGLAAGEHARAVYARQNAYLGRQRTDFLHASAIHALAVRQIQRRTIFFCSLSSALAQGWRRAPPGYSSAKRRLELV